MLLQNIPEQLLLYVRTIFVSLAISHSRACVLAMCIILPAMLIQIFFRQLGVLFLYAAGTALQLLSDVVRARGDQRSSCCTGLALDGASRLMAGCAS